MKINEGSMVKRSIVLMVGMMAGPSLLTGQEHHPPESGAASEAQPGPDMSQMMDMEMCMKMMGGQGMMGGEGMMGGQGMMGAQPATLLGQKEALGLSEPQIERLEALRKRAFESRDRHMSEMSRLGQNISSALAETPPDLDRFETLIGEQAEMHVQTQVGRARLSQEAISILTDEQRSNLRYGTRLMRSMMGRMTEGAVDSKAEPHQHGGDSRN